jgi:hypothetical protein
MSRFAKSPLSALTRSAVCTGAMLGALLGGAAQADTLGSINGLHVYGGASAGFGVASRACGEAVGCNRANFSQKMFGGVRMTPSLAAEINYFYFRPLDKEYSPATSAATGVVAEREQARTITLGINWETELLQDFTNHIRLGVALTKHKNTLTLANGETQTVREHRNAPYLGLGLSYRVSEPLRLFSHADFIMDGHDSRTYLGVGASYELGL